MCGIIGCFSANSTKINPGLLTGLDKLQHRGPDDLGLENFLIEGNKRESKKLLSLGHRRLSIIDLSQGGYQPMHSKDDRYVVVYNGEIYNYKELKKELKSLGHTFRTQSDTEVLIAAWSQWGPESLKKLIGMFAFAIFDKIYQTLTLARDAFGIKPLFYRNDENSIYFASELPALIKLIQKK